MRDEISTDDYFLAVLYNYLGYPCLRCTDTHTSTSWLFGNCPKFDAEAVLEDFNNPETTVVYKNLIDAIKTIDGCKTRARRSLGVWTSLSYSGK
jgi:hypothetical protein